MCGFIAGIGGRNLVPLLTEGLKRLEFRGYDSAGIAAMLDGEIIKIRRLGEVQNLEDVIKEENLSSGQVLMQTRWASQGRPSLENAHPLVSGGFCVVHNGNVENNSALKVALDEHYEYTSTTDTESIAHLIHQFSKETNFLDAVRETSKKIIGKNSFLVMSKDDPERIVGFCGGSPLVVGIGEGEKEGELFMSSHAVALASLAKKFIYCEPGDLVDAHNGVLTIYDAYFDVIHREVISKEITPDELDKMGYEHHMMKEIMEQGLSVRNTLDGNISSGNVLLSAFDGKVPAFAGFALTKRVLVLACGTSYHAGLILGYWLENIARIPCRVEVASEFRNRHPVVEEGTLVVGISQSGETADTLAALEEAQKINPSVSILALCNEEESRLVRMADFVFLTKAGPEIGVASTKAFTTQLVGLMLLTLALGKVKDTIDDFVRFQIIKELETLPEKIEQVLQMNGDVQKMAESLVFGLQVIDSQGNKSTRNDAIFMGRDTSYPLALEGSLKLKEISYINSVATPSGELKHGTLALVDADMPVIVIVPKDNVLSQNNLSIESTKARGGKFYIFTEEGTGILPDENTQCLYLPDPGKYVSPILYAIPLQLLSYHVAVLKDNNVDQPRNLAKSVTVE